MSTRSILTNFPLLSSNFLALFAHRVHCCSFTLLSSLFLIHGSLTFVLSSFIAVVSLDTTLLWSASYASCFSFLFAQLLIYFFGWTCVCMCLCVFVCVGVEGGCLQLYYYALYNKNHRGLTQPFHVHYQSTAAVSHHLCSSTPLL